MLGIAKPNEFRTETAQRSQKQEFGITEKDINEEYTLFRQQNGSEEALVESPLSSIANSNQFSSETARSSQGKELEITEIVINGESMPKKAPLPRIEESRDLGSRPIANSQSRTMAETETKLQRQNIRDGDFHDNPKSLSKGPLTGPACMHISLSQCNPALHSLQNAYASKTDFVTEAEDEILNRNGAISPQGHKSSIPQTLHVLCMLR